MGQPHAQTAELALGKAVTIAASDLTLLECNRTLQRALAFGVLTDFALREKQAELAAAAQHWRHFRINREIIDRAAQRFPREPIRALDAIHLAAIEMWSKKTLVTVLSLDQRVRMNAAALGIAVLPEEIDE